MLKVHSTSEPQKSFFQRIYPDMCQNRQQCQFAKQYEPHGMRYNYLNLSSVVFMYAHGWYVEVGINKWLWQQKLSMGIIKVQIFQKCFSELMKWTRQYVYSTKLKVGVKIVLENMRLHNQEIGSQSYLCKTFNILRQMHTDVMLTRSVKIMRCMNFQLGGVSDSQMMWNRNILQARQLDQI